MRIIRLDSINSTNTFLRDLAKESTLENGTAVVSIEQTAGRGQQGNYWESEIGKNLTFSILIHPYNIPVKDHFLISQLAALSIKEVLDEYVERVQIKWPNDIYVGDKKIAGILIENDFTGNLFVQSIIGIGINVNQEIFRSNAPNPVSLIQLTKKTTNLDLILENIVNRLLSKHQTLSSEKFEKIRQDYVASLYRKTGFHLYSDANGPFSAIIDRVEDNGHLVLKTTTNEVRKYTFKEVSYIR